MVKSAEEIQNPGYPTSSRRSRNAILLIPLIVILGIFWLILVRLDIIAADIIADWEFETWVNVWLVIFGILFLILILSIPRGGGQTVPSEAIVVSKLGAAKKVKKQVKAKPATMVTIEPDDDTVEFVPVSKKKETTGSADTPDATSTSDEKTEKPKDADIVAPGTKKGKVRPKLIEYPMEVEGGIYGDTFIDVDDETVIKLRTLVVEDIYLL